MASVKLRKSWLLRIGFVHSLFKIPRKFTLKKGLFFKQSFFFPQIVFSGAGVWSREHINRASRGHTGSWITGCRWDRHSTTPSDQIKESACPRLDNRPSTKSSSLSYFSCNYTLVYNDPLITPAVGFLYCSSTRMTLALNNPRSQRNKGYSNRLGSKARAHYWRHNTSITTAL